MKIWTGNNRARNHDYASKCKYHITMLKAEGVSNFGMLTGDYRIPVGNPGSSYIAASPIGKAIKAALRQIPDLHHALKLYQYALMPDHLHIIIAAEERLDEAIGRKLARFKRQASLFAGQDSIFSPGFNDQILYSSRHLDQVFKYLKENPYRLAIRRAFPDYFKKVNLITLGPYQFQAYGNLHLLDNPFKDQVVVHRATSESEKGKDIERWIHTAANGGVLVSPFISIEEKNVRKLAESVNGRIILITNEVLGERQKPYGHNFEKCVNGQLLILTPTSPPISPIVNRQTCLAMNHITSEICKI